MGKQPPPLRLVWDSATHAKQEGPEMLMAARALSSKDKSVLAAALLSPSDDTVLLAEENSANHKFLGLLSQPGFLQPADHDGHGVAYQITETGQKLLPNLLSTLFRL